MKYRALLFIVITICLAIFLWPSDALFILKNTNNIFVIDKDHYFRFIKSYPKRCRSINTCQLQKGDILIRRYVTKRLWLIDKLINPYFTHVAIYAGENRIIEASGVENNRDDDIRSINIKESDWNDKKIEDIIIFRPMFNLDSIEQLVKQIDDTANDQQFRFGLTLNNQNKISCAELIYLNLIKNNLLPPSTKKVQIISPDFLFKSLIDNSKNFSIVLVD